MDYAQYTNIYKAAINANKAHRVKIDPDLFAEEVSPQVYNEQFGTVQVNLGRRTGKTRFIVDNAKRGDIVIVAHPLIRDAYFPINRDLTVIVADKGLDAIRGAAAQAGSTIWIDEPAWVARFIPLKTIYEYLGSDNLMTFVLLGASEQSISNDVSLKAENKKLKTEVGELHNRLLRIMNFIAMPTVYEIKG